MTRVVPRLPLFMLVVVCSLVSVVRADDSVLGEQRIRLAIERSLALLEQTSATTADMRTCFTCHGQAQPVIAFVEARRRGFHASPVNIRRQVQHTYAHLKRGQKQYAEAKGQGGQVDTAGYALWTLEAGDLQPDAVTDAVIGYLLKKQDETGYWPASSNRPPSEASQFTTTYLALRPDCVCWR
ncbi:MAG: hypothetical protein R3C53_15870 [Pirellulaceae bacterium]